MSSSNYLFSQVSSYPFWQKFTGVFAIFMPILAFLLLVFFLSCP